MANRRFIETSRSLQTRQRQPHCNTGNQPQGSPHGVVSDSQDDRRQVGAGQPLWANIAGLGGTVPGQRHGGVERSKQARRHDCQGQDNVPADVDVGSEAAAEADSAVNKCGELLLGVYKFPFSVLFLYFSVLTVSFLSFLFYF